MSHGNPFSKVEGLTLKRQTLCPSHCFRWRVREPLPLHLLGTFHESRRTSSQTRETVPTKSNRIAVTVRTVVNVPTTTTLPP